MTEADDPRSDNGRGAMSTPAAEMPGATVTTALPDEAPEVPTKGSTSTRPLGGVEDPALAYHPHQTTGSPPSRRPTPRPRQLVVAAVLAAALVIGALATIGHFSRPADEIDGVAQPSQELDLNFAATARIVRVSAKPGDRVKAGQVLAEQDPQIAQLESNADTASFAADKAKLARAQTEGTLNQQQQQQAVAVADSQNAKSQKSIADTITTTTVALNQAQQRLTGATQQQSLHQQQLAVICPAGTTTPACTQIQDQVTSDANQVSLQNGAVQSAHDTLARLQDLAQQTTSLGQSKTALAQAQANAQANPAKVAADIDSAAAAVANDQARMARDLRTLSSLTITAPIDGMVSDVAAIPGQMATSEGVHNYPGPAAQGRSQTQFNLLPPSPASAAQSAPSLYLPVISMYAGPWRVVAETTESLAPSLSPGRPVEVQIPSQGHAWLRGTVAYVVGTPVAVTGVPVNAGIPARYDVIIDISHPPPSLLPGMRARVLLKAPKPLPS